MTEDDEIKAALARQGFPEGAFDKARQVAALTPDEVIVGGFFKGIEGAGLLARPDWCFLLVACGPTQPDGTFKTLVNVNTETAADAIEMLEAALAKVRAEGLPRQDDPALPPLTTAYA